MFKSASAQLRCITHLDRNTNLKCKNISLAAIKKWHLTLLLGIRDGRKITHFPWYACTVTIQAFCSPRFFAYYTPSPGTAPQGPQEKHTGVAAGGNRHGASPAWPKGHACVTRRSREPGHRSAIPGAVSYQAGSDLCRTDRMTERTRAVEDVSVLESQKG